MSGSDTVANYQAALRASTYQNTAEAPSPLVRTISFTVNDGAANSNTVTRTITVTDTTTQWTGTADTHWENAANWTNGIVPSATVKAVLTGTPAANQPSPVSEPGGAGPGHPDGGVDPQRQRLDAVGRHGRPGPAGRQHAHGHRSTWAAATWSSVTAAQACSETIQGWITGGRRHQDRWPPLRLERHGRHHEFRGRRQQRVHVAGPARQRLCPARTGRP